jgi:processive 1,2-diacylglycerol beta-glucosyltransferase
MPRILLLHASVGSGHKRAADALARAFRIRQPGQVWVEDTLDHAALLFRQAYTRTYLELSDRAPALWGYSYYSTDKPESTAFKDLRTRIDRIGVTGLGRRVRRLQPEAIVCTHFLPVHLLSRTKGQARLPQPLYCVVTDFTAHVFWAYNQVDGYFVATDDVRDLLIRRGVPPSIIRVTGIPVDPAILSAKDPAAIRRVRGLGTGPVLTFFGGGLDSERVRAAVARLLEIGLRGTLVVVAGRNAELVEALRGLSSSPTLHLIVLGFIDYVDDLVVASDLVISKPGGLIVSEVLGRAVPLLLVDPIPGQEDWNADYVTSAGAGLQLRLMAALPATLARLMDDPQRVQSMQACAKEVGRPAAALDIADHVLRDLASGEHGFKISERPR